MGKIMKKRTKVENKRKVCRMKLNVWITKGIYVKTFPPKGTPFVMELLNEEEKMKPMQKKSKYNENVQQQPLIYEEEKTPKTLKDEDER